MKKQKWLMFPLALSLIITPLGTYTTAFAKGGETSDAHFFTRIQTGQNGDLIQYSVIDEDGNEVTAQSSAKTSSKKKASSSSLPSSYDSREETDSVTSIKDQGVTGSCWTFATMKALEASSILNGLTDAASTDFSENHLAWYSYHGVTDSSDSLYGDAASYSSSLSGSDIYDMGGNAYIASAILANWWGAADETDAPFTGDTTAEVASMASSMESADDSLRYASAVRLKESNCYDESDSDEIKEAVMEYGALSVSFYMPTSDTEYNNTVYESDDVCSIYGTKSTSYANHSVTIVGWDDDFNTYVNNSSGKSGAWLIANSYGEEFGVDGYFWLSYYDSSICEIFSFEAEANDTYDTNFSYDGYGWSSGLYDTSDIAMENIFTNEEDSAQSLNAAGFYTYTDDQAYTVEVYRNSTEGSPTSGTLISECTVSGTAEYSGYHTVSLASPAAISADETFTVRITFLANGGTAYALFEGESDSQSGYTYGSSSGQSYLCLTSNGSVSSSSSWSDTTAYETSESHGPGPSKTTTTNYNNVCVKAFSNSIGEEEYASLNASNEENNPDLTADNSSSSTESDNTTDTGSNSSGSSSDNSDTTAITSSVKKIVMGKGETINLLKMIKPASIRKSLTLKSSNSKIVKVTKKGKLKAKKTGTAKITVYTSSGSKLSIKVKVKKAPKSIQATARKTTLQRKKSTKIVTKLSKKSASYKITYKSLNPKVATVTSTGKIKAKKKGTARIRVSTFNKKKAYVRITVK